VHHVGTLLHGGNFDPSQLNALDFIASQVAPVLEIMNAAIRREHAVAQTKHDLKTPTGEIIERSRRLLAWLDEGRMQCASVLQQLRVVTSQGGIPEFENGGDRDIEGLEWLQLLLERAVLIPVPEKWLKEQSEDQSYSKGDADREDGPAWRAVLHELDNIHLDGVLTGKLVDTLDTEKAFLDLYTPELTYLEGEIIARLRAGFALSSQYKNVRLKFERRIRDVVPALYIDPVFVERVFRNLLDNAIKYADRNSDIVIRARKDEKGYYIDIEDQGLPVNADEKERIFTGFRASMAIATGERGKGLGLKMSQQMMRRHGGDILVTRLTNPTVFTVFFPSELSRRNPQKKEGA
jgi:signal transduction histidine kinase